MHSIILHKEFINDLSSSNDAAFVSRIMTQVFDEMNASGNQRNDHRYKGIPNAWIRYASRGKTQFRIIYLIRGNEMIFYRCGPHSVEDRLNEPTIMADELTEISLDKNEVETMVMPETFLFNHKQKIVYSAIVGRKNIPNKCVYIVSPFIDPKTLQRGHRIGETLDHIRQDGAEVYIITAAEEIGNYTKLQSDLRMREIEFTFVPKLHSKIYLFITNDSYNHITSDVPSLGILGSSNLTLPGISQQVGLGNIETNFTVPESSIEELEDIVMELYSKSSDYQQTLRKKMRNHRRQ